MSGPDYEIPNDDDVSPDDIQPGADLSGADLSEAALHEADLSGARLRGVDLSEAELHCADLSGAFLYAADLSEANLPGTDLSKAQFPRANLSEARLSFADLSGAEFPRADLSEAKLHVADLSEANIQYADLSEADLREVTLAGAALSRGTEIGTPSRRIEQEFEDNDWISEEEMQDKIARVNRELRAAYSDNGLLSRARTARVRERRARRREAKAEGGLRSTAAWFGSRLSGIFTGYGVRLLPVVAWMLALYLLSAAVYWQLGGMGWRYSLYYSVVTFTTAPPEAPPAGIPAVVASIETFAGTAAIVFLGYVLGSRERV